MKNLLAAMLLSCLLFLHCNSPDIEELDFFGVELQNIDPDGFDGVRLTGRIIGQGRIETGECGFLWSKERDLVEAQSPQAQTLKAIWPAQADNGKFEGNIDQLVYGDTIWVRAYARATLAETGERIVYSGEIQAFIASEIVALTGLPAVANNSAVLTGQLRGLLRLGKSVDHHGHVVSATNPEPALGCSDCRWSDRGYNNDDAIFGSQIADLEFNTRYYVRAYAISDKDTSYSLRTDTFRVRDGWLRIADLPEPYSEGAGVAVETAGLAFVALGCQNENGVCTGDELDDQRECWRFNPGSPDDLGNLGNWTQTGLLPDSLFNRTNAAMFVLDGAIYAVFGSFFNTNGEEFPVGSFFRYNPTTKQWAKPNLGSAIPRRTDATVFVANGKAYVGAGRDQDYNVFQDFWEFNPMTQVWRPVADIPKGRFGAAAFCIGDTCYVATGQTGTGALRDCWRFRPPADDNDPGLWEEVMPMPSEAHERYQAVAFSINGKGYIATGYHPDAGYLGDLWQYNPGSNTWKARTPFQGISRTNAIGFALNGFGYLGTGNTKVLLNGGLSATERSLPDFWRYIPEN